MRRDGSATVLIPIMILTALAAGSFGFPSNAALPTFGRDTVLVWQIANQGSAATFVVRIAEFTPNRFFEWENATTQGTVMIESAALAEADNYVGSRLFEAGKENKTEDMTTLWLSLRIFEELKENNKAELKIDSIPGWMELESTGEIALTVNRSRARLPVIKVRDSRGSERWFLDSAENPLMVKQIFRTYSQTLSSITTDRSNTLRWIKGKKLNSPNPVI